MFNFEIKNSSGSVDILPEIRLDYEERPLWSALGTAFACRTPVMNIELHDDVLRNRVIELPP